MALCIALSLRVRAIVRAIRAVQLASLLWCGSSLLFFCLPAAGRKLLQASLAAETQPTAMAETAEAPTPEPEAEMAAAAPAAEGGGRRLLQAAPAAERAGGRPGEYSVRCGQFALRWSAGLHAE